MANDIYSGVQTTVLIGKEITFGTAVTCNKTIGGFIQTLNLTEKNNLERVHGIGNRASQALVAKGYEFSASMDYVYQAGRLIAYAVGSDTTALVGSTYDHTLNMVSGTADVALTPFSMGVSHDSAADFVSIYAGCKVNSLKISGGIDQLLKVSADILGATSSHNLTGTLTYADDADDVLAPQMATLAIGGVTVAQVQNFEFNLSNNLEYPHQIGNRIASAGVPKTRQADVRATFNFEDAESLLEYSTFMSDASAAYTPTTVDVAAKTMTITVTNGGATTALRKLVINMTGMKIDELSRSIPVDGLVTCDISAMVTDFSAAPIVVTNMTTTAYITEV